MKKWLHEHRIAVLALCVVFAAALLLNVMFDFHAIGHDCCGEDCPVCDQIAMLQGEMSLLGFAFVALIVLVLMVLPAIRTAGHFEAHTAQPHLTLVAEHVRLNN